MEQRYTIGLDYGSLSCRGVLVCAEDGCLLAEEEFTYPHGVLYDALPDGTRLPRQWALQDPQDYVDALLHIVPALLGKSGIRPDRVAGLGLDTTASTVLAVDRERAPLCQRPEFYSRPHAWPKLWKHHAAWREAEELTAEAKESLDLARYGGAVGAEFLPPKVLQCLREDPEVFDRADTFFECGDWLTSLLTGHEVRSGATLTCKALWSPAVGWPRGRLFEQIAEKLAFRSGVRPVVAWPGQSVGTVSPEMARQLGLSPGTTVCAPQMDAYAGLPGSGVSGPGILSMMLGTSNAYLLLSREQRLVPGICGAVPDSILPGYTGYAAGQSSAGDTLKWFTENCVPSAYEQAAREQGLGIHSYLTSLAVRQKPGESGLIALDWWNGNKSVLNNAGLSGLLLGMTLRTRPEDVYRALIEATAFGARRIVEAFRQSEVDICSVIASGGMAMKNSMLMQIYADVLGVPIAVSPCTQAAAMGSAVYAAAAGGIYRSVVEAVESMSPKSVRSYHPEEASQAAYNRLFSEYMALHDYFGRGENRVMERLRFETADIPCN